MKATKFLSVFSDQEVRKSGVFSVNTRDKLFGAFTVNDKMSERL